MRDIAVLCVNAEQFRIWAESRGRLKALNAHRAEGEGWRAFRIVSGEMTRGRPFSEIVLLQDWRHGCPDAERWADYLSSRLRDVSVLVK